MENLLTNNQMSIEDFKLCCINHHLKSKPSQEEIDFTDFTSFIINTSIHNEEGMGFLKAYEYHEGEFDNAIYSSGESETWDALEKLTGMDYDTMEEEFKNVTWEDNDNTAIATIGENKYAILRV